MLEAETVPSSVGMTIVAGAGVLQMLQHNTEVRCWKLTWVAHVYSVSQPFFTAHSRRHFQSLPG
ncbi:hypothetical protein J6590_076344 [Homalodisca vitripennis]|nr:hypothetical protein J6590_076344 [Homalodisca vitripennis]